MKTPEQKLQVIYNAIDAIMDVVQEIPEADAHYFIHSCKSVVTNLNTLTDTVWEEL